MPRSSRSQHGRKAASSPYDAPKIDKRAQEAAEEDEDEVKVVATAIRAACGVVTTDAEMEAVDTAAIRREMAAVKALKPLFWLHICDVARKLKAQRGRHYNEHDWDKKKKHETAFVVVCQQLTRDDEDYYHGDGGNHALWLSALSAEFVVNARRPYSLSYTCLNTFQISKDGKRLAITCDGRTVVDGHKEIKEILDGRVVDARYPGAIVPMAERYFAVPVELFYELTIGQ